jgi:haloalkane dehalogenase
MRKVLIVLAALATVIVALVAYNHYDVQATGDRIAFDPAVPILRTADAAFEVLEDFPFAPHYVEITDPDLGALRVHYLDEGPTDGHIIVLLHGQATWSYSYRKMIPILTAAGYRVIVPDLVGFGRSDKPADWNAHTFEKHVDWLAATLAALNIEGATGFMFDWGGYFGLRVVTEQPDVFSRLLLVTTTMPRGNSVVGAAWTAGWRRYALKQETFPIGSMVSDMTANDIDAMTIKGLDAPYPDELHKAGPRRMPMMIPSTPLHPSAAPNRRAWEALREWNKPTLTLVSEQIAERSFDPQEFHDQIPGTAGQPHAIYPDTGFFLIEDIPEQLAEKTIEFIEQS